MVKQTPTQAFVDSEKKVIILVIHDIGSSITLSFCHNYTHRGRRLSLFMTFLLLPVKIFKLLFDEIGDSSNIRRCTYIMIHLFHIIFVSDIIIDIV